MPILADISRRFHLLTTDAKPDPPRIVKENYTNNLSPSASDSSEKSSPRRIPERNERREDPKSPLDQRESDREANESDESENSDLENEASSTGSRSDSKETKKPRFKTKVPYKTAQSANIVNYNIVNSNWVKIGATKTYVCNINPCEKKSKETNDSNTTKDKIKTMPKMIEDLSTCEKEITIDDIFIIKTHIGNGWRDVVRRLGYSEGQLDQFEENYKGRGIDEVIYQAFLDWKQANTKDAQIGTLTSTLWSCREYECAEKLAAAQKIPT